MTHHEEAEGLPSASKFDGGFLCLGKWEAEKRYPVEDESSDARRGHRIHEALEKSDLSELSPSEQITASICMDVEAQLIEEYNFEAAGEVIWEQRFWDVDENFNKLWSARIDYVRLSGDRSRALVNDYKTGWGLPTPIHSNWQVRAAAALIWFHYGVDEVVVGLIHPHHPESRMESAVYSAEQCAYFLTTIRGNVDLMEQPDNPRTPNGVSCQFCRFKHECPERQHWLARIAQNVRDEIKERGYTALIDKSPEQRGEHFKQLKELKANCEIIMERYTSMAVKEENSVKGWRVQKGWMRSVVDETKALDMIEKEFGSKTATDAMVFSLTELEEVLRRSLRVSKEVAKARVEACLGEQIKFKPKNPWLVELRNFYEARTQG